MTKRRTVIIISAIAAVVVIAAVIVILILMNGGSESYDNINVREIVGDVTVENKGDVYKAYTNMKLSGGFAMTTAAQSHSYMSLDDEKYVKLEEESRAKFESAGTGGKSTSILLEYGQLSSEIVRPLRAGEGYTVTTPNAVLSVRGTLFITKAHKDSDGKWLTDVYTFGGSVSSHRILPDGTPVDEDVRINAGYKATVRTDDDTTYYIQESADRPDDNVDPISIGEVDTDVLAFVYAAAEGGHDVCFTQTQIMKEFEERGKDITQYTSYRTGKALTTPAETSAPESEPADDETSGSEEDTSADETDAPGETSAEEETSDTTDDTSGQGDHTPPAVPTVPGTTTAGNDDTTIPSDVTTGTTAAPDNVTPPGQTEGAGEQITNAPDEENTPPESVSVPEDETPADDDTTSEPGTTTGDETEKPEDDGQETTADTEDTAPETTTADTTDAETTSEAETTTTKDYELPDAPVITTSGSSSPTPEPGPCSHSYVLKNIVLVSGAGSSAVFSAKLICPNCGDTVTVSAAASEFKSNSDGSIEYKIIFVYKGKSYTGTYIDESGSGTPCDHIYGLHDITLVSGSGSSAAFTATLTCSNCSDEVSVTGTVTDFATLSDGRTKYFIDFTYNGETWSETYIDTGTASCVHDYAITYDEPEFFTFTWSSDHTSCVAKFYCKKGCGAYREVVCTVDPPYTTADGTVYTAWCEFGDETFSDTYIETTAHEWIVPETSMSTSASLALTYKWASGSELPDLGSDNSSYYAEIYVWYGAPTDPYSVSDCWIATVPYVAEEDITATTTEYVTLTGGYFNSSLYPAFSGTAPTLSTGDTVTLGIEIYSPDGTVAKQMDALVFTVS